MMPPARAPPRAPSPRPTTRGWRWDANISRYSYSEQLRPRPAQRRSLCHGKTGAARQTARAIGPRSNKKRAAPEPGTALSISQRTLRDLRERRTAAAAAQRHAHSAKAEQHQRPGRRLGNRNSVDDAGNGCRHTTCANAKVIDHERERAAGISEELRRVVEIDEDATRIISAHRTGDCRKIGAGHRARLSEGHKQREGRVVCISGTSQREQAERVSRRVAGAEGEEAIRIILIEGSLVEGESTGGGRRVMGRTSRAEAGGSRTDICGRVRGRRTEGQR